MSSITSSRSFFRAVLHLARNRLRSTLPPSRIPLAHVESFAPLAAIIRGQTVTDKEGEEEEEERRRRRRGRRREKRRRTAKERGWSVLDRPRLLPVSCFLDKSPESDDHRAARSCSPVSPEESDFVPVINVNSPPDQLEREFFAWLTLGSTPDRTPPSTVGSMEKEPSPSGSSPMEETDLRKAKKRGTNLYGRTYCPGRPLSMDERQQIIQYHTSGMKVNAISKTLSISHGCVSKIIARYRQTGILTPVSSPERRKRKKRAADKKEDPSPSTSSPVVPPSPLLSSPTFFTSPLPRSSPPRSSSPLLFPSPLSLPPLFSPPPPPLSEANILHPIPQYPHSGPTYTFLQTVQAIPSPQISHPITEYTSYYHQVYNS